MAHLPQGFGAGETHAPMAAVAICIKGGTDHGTGIDAHDVEHAMHRVDVMDKTGTIGIREAPHLAAGQYMAGGALDLLFAKTLALGDEFRGYVVGLEEIALMLVETPGVRNLNLDADLPQCRGVLRQQREQNFIAGIEALHVADLYYFAG